MSVSSPRKHAIDDPHEPNSKRVKRKADASSGHKKESLDSNPQDLSKLLVSVPDTHKYADQTSNFSPGAIIGIRLVNFQVATDSTFHFKPFLNLILGSNGTGKSTIVNAIFLLFRGKLSDLDRASYDEFIQFGKRYAVVSALIQGREGEENPIISFLIQWKKTMPGRPKTAPQWHLNGIAISDDEIDSFINQRHIQVGNLCQFLPQFRVAAFSGESPQQRLLSTESAIGYDGMIEHHHMLGQVGKQQADLKRTVGELTESIKILSDQQSLLAQRKAQLELANRDKDQAETLRRVIDISKYHEIDNQIKFLRKEHATAKRTLLKFDEETSQNRDIIAEEMHKLEELKNKREEATQNTTMLKRSFRNVESHIITQRSKVSEIVKQTTELKLRIERSHADIDRFESEEQNISIRVRKLQHELNENGMDAAVFQELREQCSNLEDEYTRSEASFRSLSDEKIRIGRRIDSTNLQIQNNEYHLTSLKKAANSSTVRNPESFRNVIYDSTTFLKSVAFVQSNQDKFEKPIIMPALLSLRITDRRLLPIFSEVMQMVHLQKFVCQTKKDQQLLTELASKIDDLDIKTTYVSQSLDKSDGKFSSETLAKLKRAGFQGVVSDKLDGPEPVLRFMDSLGLSRLPFTLSEIDAKTRNDIRGIANNSALSYADSRTFYQVQRSKYGRRLLTETSRPLNSKVSKWMSMMVQRDTSEEQERLEREIKSGLSELEKLQEDLDLLAVEENSKRDELTILRTKLRDMKTQIGSEEQLRNRHAELLARQSQLSRKLKEVKTSKQIQNERLFDCLNLLDSALKDLSKAIGDVPPELIKELQSAEYVQSKYASQITDTHNQIEFLTEALEIQRRYLSQAVLKKEEAVRNLQSQHIVIRENFERATSWLRSKGRLTEGSNMAKSRSLESLEDELNRLNATVTLHSQRPESLSSVCQQLENVENRLREDTRQLELNTKNLNDLSKNNGELRQHWENELRNLVQRVSVKFSELFGKLGCRGSVTLDQGNQVEVSAWGIDINVAFREEEAELSKLSKYRQSGGERAVSTAVYLLALQEMATAPFRVLDEINQGMDEHNEHMTMNFFVNMACEPNAITGSAQQCFLITPKLISNVPCHRNMNVVFIVGGVAVGDTGKLILSAQPQSTLRALEEEIESENEDESDEDN